MAAGGPWLRAGGWPHSLPKPLPWPRSARVGGSLSPNLRVRDLSLGPTSPLQVRPSSLALIPCPGPGLRPHQPGLLHDKRWDKQTTTASDSKIKRGPGQEVEERRLEEEPVRKGKKQCSPMTKQAWVYPSAPCLRHGPDYSTGSEA